MVVATCHHDASAVYRSILRMGPYSIYFVYMFFLPVIGFCCVMTPLLQLVYGDPDSSTYWLGHYLPVAIFVAFMWIFFFSVSTWGAESIEWDFMTLQAPWVPFTRKHFRRDLKMINSSLLAHAQNGVLQALVDDTNDPHFNFLSSENVSSLPTNENESKEETEMLHLLQEVLPELTVHDKYAVATSLLQDGINPQRLRKASLASSGQNLLITLLSTNRVLSKGQVLSLATHPYDVKIESTSTC